jgi:hexosaminidase
MIAEQTDQEKYQLTIRTTDNWELLADCHVGFLRGLETFSQLFERKNNKYFIKGRPILIDDQPDFVWRGVMIDSSRHFLPIDAIKHQIDALMYNKMSVLHWHITDEDSFPM